MLEENNNYKEKGVKMKGVSIFMQEVKDSTGKLVGKISILRGEPNLTEPRNIMDNAVDEYIGNNPYNQFLEIFQDNHLPLVRVIIEGLEYFDYK